jgi:hypothetical protein
LSYANNGESGETYNVEMATSDLSRKPRSLQGQEQSPDCDTIDDFGSNLSLSLGFLANVFADSRRLFRVCGLDNTGPDFWNGPGQLSARDETDPYEEEDEEWEEWSDEE